MFHGNGGAGLNTGTIPSKAPFQQREGVAHEPPLPTGIFTVPEASMVGETKQ